MWVECVGSQPGHLSAHWSCCEGGASSEASGIGSVTARESPEWLDWEVFLTSIINLLICLFSTSKNLTISLFISLLSLHTQSCDCCCLFLSPSPVLPHLFRWKETGLQSLVSLEEYQGLTQWHTNISHFFNLYYLFSMFWINLSCEKPPT